MASSSGPNDPIFNVPAVVEWIDADGQARHLCQGSSSAAQVTFSVHFDAASNVAFFSLKVPVRLGLSGTRRPLYLHIEPERVTSLVYNGPSNTPESVRGKLGTASVMCLSFVLSKPADLIMPAESSSLVPVRPGAHGGVLGTVQLVARQTSISIYSESPSSVPESVFQSLSTAVGDGSLMTYDLAADLSTLYGGRGGKIFEGANFSAPPSYDKLGAPPPSSSGDELMALPPPPSLKRGPAESVSSRKRRRGGALETAGYSPHVEDICRKMIDEIMSQSREEMRRNMEDMRREVESLSKSKEEMSKSMEDMRREVAISRSGEEQLSRTLEETRSDMMKLEREVEKMSREKDKISEAKDRISREKKKMSREKEKMSREEVGPDDERTEMTVSELHTEIRTEVKAQLGELKADMERDLERSRTEIKAETMEYMESRLDRLEGDLDVYSMDEVDYMLSNHYNAEAVDEEIEKAKADIAYELGDRDVYTKEEVDEMLRDYFDAEAVDEVMQQAKAEIKEEVGGQINQAEARLNERSLKMDDLEDIVLRCLQTVRRRFGVPDMYFI